MPSQFRALQLIYDSSLTDQGANTANVLTPKLELWRKCCNMKLDQQYIVGMNGDEM